MGQMTQPTVSKHRSRSTQISPLTSRQTS